MKKIILSLLLVAIPALSHASNILNNNAFKPNLNIPSRFASSSQTDILEWGCPIAEVVEANSTTEAMAKIGRACMDDVKKAAVQKPGVFEVINVSVVWPDVKVSHTQDGYRLEGTLFLETMVMKGQE